MTQKRIVFPWILDRRRDLLYYIGSSAAGWSYAVLIVWALWTLENPLRDPLLALRWGGLQLSLNLELLVVASWALILDAPHIWATLARTLFDPDEWATRRREIGISFLWFLLGPLAILLPYAVAAAIRYAGWELPAEDLVLGSLVFLVFFRLWAYYHVVRQHWGFFQLYKRKANDHDPVSDRVDYWFFNLTLYLPLVWFLTSDYYLKTPGFPDLGLRTPLVAGFSIGDVVYPAARFLYLIALLAFLAHQVYRWTGGRTINGSKLLYLLPVIPLHAVAYSDPMMAVFVVPLVTVGHNIQYHRIVLSFAQNKYVGNANPRYRVPRGLFKNFAVYFGVGLLFTFLLYRGPLVEFFTQVAATHADGFLFKPLAMMAGIEDPSSLALGQRVFAALLLGFAMQHYYLDSKIWRVNRDKAVQRHLNV